MWENDSRHIYTIKMICDKKNATTDLQELVKQSMDFDVVIANPPYQGNTKSSGNTIWDKFVATSLKD